MNQLDKYYDDVFNYAEHIGLPEYVLVFEPEHVAKSFNKAICSFFILGISERMAAVLLFSLTMNKQVMKYEEVVN